MLARCSYVGHMLNVNIIYNIFECVLKQKNLRLSSKSLNQLIEFELFNRLINSFQANVPFELPLNKLGNRRLSDVFKGELWSEMSQKTFILHQAKT